MILKYLIRKEVLIMRRNAFIPRLIVVFPILIMCIMPWVVNMEVKNIVVDVVDSDRSTLSQQLVHRIEASDYFVFNGQKHSFAEAMSDIERSGTDVVVEIPPSFERDILRGENPQVLVAANAVNGTKGSMGSAYMSNIVTEHVAPDIAALSGRIATLYLYNKNLNYKLFMIPSLIAVLIMMMCGFLPALNIVGEKESGTIEAMNVTPVSKTAFIFAKLIPYWVVALLVMTICFALSWAVYGITSEGNLLLVYMLAMLLAFIFSAFGLIVSNYNNTMQQAVFVMWFCVVCMMLLGGLFTPVHSMPDWAQWIARINPMHYFIDAIRTVFVRGGDLQSISYEVTVLAATAVIMSIWAVKSYKKNA